jgi:hypothetical protein
MNPVMCASPGFLLIATFGFLQLACIFLHTIVCPKRGFFFNFFVWGESLDTAATDVPVTRWFKYDWDKL